ncbi:MAG: PD-(D/E)XK nuclease family protein [Acidithiobacillus sp.]
MNDYLTDHGTNQARLKQLHELLRDGKGGSEIPLAATGGLLPRLRELRDLFAKKAQTIARHLPADHPVMMPFGFLGDLSIAQLHETTHTKMLAWLLDPSKPHGFGTALLRALMNEAGANLPEVTDVQVHTEYRLPRGLGRVDIYATGSTTGPTPETWGLWIEAKSKQTTQEGIKQLERYERHRSHWRDETAGRDYGIFLTPDGRHTRSTDNHEQWPTLSYIRLAKVLWREAESHRGALGFEWLRLYLSGIIKEYAGVHWESLDTLPYFQILELETSL